MNVKALAKAQISVLKNGLLLAFVLTMAFYLLRWIWDVVLSLGYNPFAANWANFSTVAFLRSSFIFSFNVAIFLISAYLIGLAFEKDLFKRLIFDLLNKLPLIGALVQSLNHFERIKKEGAPEVKFELTPNSGIWFKGWVSKEWKDEITGRVVCGVVLPMFVHPIGAYACIEKDKLIYTGRQAPENIIDCLSGGLIGRK